MMVVVVIMVMVMVMVVVYNGSGDYGHGNDCGYGRSSVRMLRLIRCQWLCMAPAQVAEDPLPGSSLPPLARTLNARNMCLCSEVLAALQTAKLAETCLMAGASAAVAAFLDDRMPAMKPDCRLKACTTSRLAVPMHCLI